MKIAYFQNYPDLIGEKQLGEINVLLKQLSPKARTIARADLELVMLRGTFIYALDVMNQRVVGIGTLTRSYKPVAFFGTIEDVVVDKGYRKFGIGTELLKQLLEAATLLQMDYVDLTSNPQRTEANRRYVALKAEKRETNVY